MEQDFIIITDDETKNIEFELKKQEKIRHFQTEIHDISEMFKELKEMVQDDDLKLDDIFEMIKETEEETEEAVEELEDARRLQNSLQQNKLLLYTFFLMSGIFTFKYGAGYLLIKGF